MKNQLCLILFSGFLTLFVVSTAKAQVLIGGKAGINIASFDWDDATANSDLITGAVITPQVAFVSVFEFADWFGLQAEIQYVQKGAKITFDCENCTVNTQNGQQVTLSSLEQNVSYRSNYIDVPLLARFKIGSENFAFTGLLGPSFGMALSGRQKFYQRTVPLVNNNGQQQAGEASVLNDVEKLRFDKDYNRFDMGVIGGVGLAIGAGPGAVIFDARYVLGLTNMVKNAGLTEKTQNRGFQIGAGYIVRL